MRGRPATRKLHRQITLLVESLSVVGSPMHSQSYPSPDKLQFSDRNWFALGELTFLNAKDRTCAVLENEVLFALVETLTQN